MNYIKSKYEIKKIDLRVGDSVTVEFKYFNNKEKRIFKGVIIAKSSNLHLSSIKVLRTSDSPGERIVKTFLTHNQDIKIELTKRVNYRGLPDRRIGHSINRAKLYYLKSRFGKSARLV